MSERLLPDEPRRTIRLFPDYFRDWPLWENSTPWRDSPYTMTPEDYGLSQELAAAIRKWHDLWESHFHWERGWDLPSNRTEWRRQGELVASQLRKEVAEWADVEYDGGRPY